MNDAKYYLLGILLICLVTWSCKRKVDNSVKSSEITERENSIYAAPRWNIYNKDGKKVEEIRNAPGYLISAGSQPPPGVPMTKHPFINAVSHDISEENFLYKLLKRADSFDEYVILLKKNGYKVVSNPKDIRKQKK